MFLHKRKSSVIIGILFSIGLGVLLHFVYEWSDYNKIVGFFSAVNESVWEHLKLLFIPVTVFSLIQWLFVRKENKGFLLSRVIALIIGMLWIVSSFYTISGIVGKNDISVVNIGIFVIGVVITFLLSEIIMKSIFNAPRYSDTIAFIILFIFALLFAVWTYNPPKIGLFAIP